MTPASLSKALLIEDDRMEAILAGLHQSLDRGAVLERAW